MTVQTALGFLLTMLTIGLIPAWVESWGWRYAYMPLAIGPLLGIAAMAKLRALERARKAAGGYVKATDGEAAPNVRRLP